MFSLRKVITQCTVTCAFRNYARYTKPSKDPGVGHRRKVLPVEENEDFEEYEGLEPDFLQAGQSHKEYLREKETFKEREKYLIVREKYFKEKQPNFLTWHDKEQIRYLHCTDPEEWTSERLSEGFPASPEVIKKIVKSNFTKKSQSKITNHDEAVQKNWTLFKEGKMSDLPSDLVHHLKKFTNRALNFKPFVSPEQKGVAHMEKNNVRTDFSDIITSYKKYKQKVPEIEGTSEIKTNSDNQEENLFRGRHVTLNRLQHNLRKAEERGKEIGEEDKYILAKVKRNENKRTVQIEKRDDENRELPRLVELSQQKYQGSTGIQQHRKSEKDLSHLNYPERIDIPKDVYKKDFIYKLNDCYYDDDGEFLYRVPGMY